MCAGGLRQHVQLSAAAHYGTTHYTRERSGPWQMTDSKQKGYSMMRCCVPTHLNVVIIIAAATPLAAAFALRCSRCTRCSRCCRTSRFALLQAGTTATTTATAPGGTCCAASTAHCRRCNNRWRYVLPCCCCSSSSRHLGCSVPAVVYVGLRCCSCCRAAHRPERCCCCRW